MKEIARRHFLQVAAGAAAAGTLISVDAHGQSKPTVNLQLGWLLSGNQIGEVCAKALGYYDQEGIEMRFQAGGPNIDGVAVVAAGRLVHLTEANRLVRSPVTPRKAVAAA